jgi:hypothetical protein
MRAGNEREFVSGGSDGLLNIFSLLDVSDPDECLVSTINTGESVWLDVGKVVSEEEKKLLFSRFQENYSEPYFPFSPEEAIEKMGYLDHERHTYLWSLTANETISLWDLQKETQIWHSGTSFRDDLASFGKVPVDYLLGCLTADDSSNGFYVTAGNFQGDGIVFNVTPEQSVALTYLRGSGTSAHYSSLRSLVINPANGKIYTGSLLSLSC